MFPIIFNNYFRCEGAFTDHHVCPHMFRVMMYIARYGDVYIFLRGVLWMQSDQSSIHPYHFPIFSISNFHFVYDGRRM